MPSWAAFLRAINVGGRRITGSGLCAPFTEMGFEDAQSFRASGNVVFTAAREPQAALTRRIEKGLEDALGYDVAVFLRSASKMRALAAHEPFEPARVSASTGKLQVALLAKRPTQSAQKRVLALATDDDMLAFGDRELYWLPSGGTQDTALDMKAIGRAVGANTFRTKGTIDQMAAKWFTEGS